MHSEDSFDPSKFLPAIGLLVYGVGFVIINTYLSKYAIYEVSILSFNYIKAGVLFLMYNTFLYATIVIKGKDHTPVDKKQWLDLAIFSMVISIFYSLIIGAIGILISDNISNGYFMTWNAVVIFSISILSILLVLILRYSLKLVVISRLVGLLACVVLTTMIFIESTIVFRTIIYGTGTIYFGSFVFLRLQDAIHGDAKEETLNAKEEEEKDMSEIFFSFLPFIGMFVMVFSILFGKLIYPLIPLEIGGGKSYVANFYIKDDYMNELKSIPLVNEVEKGGQYEVVYLSEKSVYMNIDNRILSIPIDQIIGFQKIANVKESSSLRPRVDGRQRSGSGEPAARAAAPR